MNITYMEQDFLFLFLIAGLWEVPEPLMTILTLAISEVHRSHHITIKQDHPLYLIYDSSIIYGYIMYILDVNTSGTRVS